jgi:hypothetical protein
MGTRPFATGAIEFAFLLKYVGMIKLVVNFIVELNYKNDSDFLADYTL